MTEVQQFAELIHKTTEEERSIAYKQASDILKTLTDDGIKEYDTEELIHFCIFRTCLIDIKITKLIKLILEVSK